MDMDVVEDLEDTLETSPKSPDEVGSDLSDLFEPPDSKPKRPTPSKKRPRKNVQMRMEDKLKIVDDVPTSAVEMAVKEKFLKKVQRQERIVEEIKFILKPFYNRKRISKQSYKDIMRKCVPKVMQLRRLLYYPF